MDAVILIGIQASGKSTFYQQRFAATHVRVNLDMLRTRHREKRLVETCLEIGQPFVVDNTNPTREDRARYVGPAHDAGFRVIGYYFQSEIEACKTRNAERSEEARIPVAGLLGTYGRLQPPAYDEGFDALFYVRIEGDGRFVAEEWKE